MKEKEPIREEDSSNLRSDNSINTESERLKLSKELNSNDVINANGIENIIDINKNKEKNGLEEKEKEEENQSDEEEDENFEITDDNIQIYKKYINIEKTSASEVLEETKISKEDNFDLLKIFLKFIAKKEYKWVVYRTPSEIHKFFKALYKSLKHDENAKNFLDSFQKMKNIK